MPVFQELVGEGNAAYVEAVTRIIKGMPVIDTAGAPTPSWVARKGVAGWEFPTDAQMFGYGEAAAPIGFDPTVLTLPSNVCTYNFANYRKVKTVAVTAATSIANSTLTAVQAKWIGGGMINFEMGGTGFAITPAGGGYIEHGRPTVWTPFFNYTVLIVKFNYPHIFWLAPGEWHA